MRTRASSTILKFLTYKNILNFSLLSKFLDSHDLTNDKHNAQTISDSVVNLGECMLTFRLQLPLTVNYSRTK